MINNSNRRQEAEIARAVIQDQQIEKKMAPEGLTQWWDNRLNQYWLVRTWTANQSKTHRSALSKWFRNRSKRDSWLICSKSQVQFQIFINLYLEKPLQIICLQLLILEYIHKYKTWWKAIINKVLHLAISMIDRTFSNLQLSFLKWWRIDAVLLIICR